MQIDFSQFTDILNVHTASVVLRGSSSSYQDKVVIREIKNDNRNNILEYDSINGYTAYEECVNGCGYTTFKAIAAFGHTELVEKAPAVDPTCTTNGITAVMGCDRCNDINKGGDVIEALGHNWIEIEIKGGRITYQCTACDELRYEETNFTLDVLPNDPSVVFNAGDTITIEISLRDNPGIWSFGFEMYIIGELVSVESSYCAFKLTDVLFDVFCFCSFVTIKFR